MVGGGGGRLACGSRRCARLAAFWLPAAARGGATGRRLVWLSEAAVGRLPAARVFTS